MVPQTHKAMAMLIAIGLRPYFERAGNSAEELKKTIHLLNSQGLIMNPESGKESARAASVGIVRYPFVDMFGNIAEMAVGLTLEFASLQNEKEGEEAKTYEVPVLFFHAGVVKGFAHLMEDLPSDKFASTETLAWRFQDILENIAQQNNYLLQCVSAVADCAERAKKKKSSKK